MIHPDRITAALDVIEAQARPTAPALMALDALEAYSYAAQRDSDLRPLTHAMRDQIEAARREINHRDPIPAYDHLEALRQDCRPQIEATQAKEASDV